MRRNVEMEGMSDLQIFLPNGRMIHIELKGPKGCPSPEQGAWGRELAHYGHRWVVVRTVEELYAELRAHGVDHWSMPKSTLIK